MSSVREGTEKSVTMQPSSIFSLRQEKESTKRGKQGVVLLCSRNGIFLLLLLIPLPVPFASPSNMMQKAAAGEKREKT
jgi:hypothetical protein